MRLIRTDKFTKQASKLIKNNRSLHEKLNGTLNKLSDNLFDPSLYTHKLKGELEGRYSSRLSYEYRIVFKIVKEDELDCILLLDIGTHDEVY